MSLRIVHTAAGTLAHAASSLPVWKTCLRTVTFAPPSEPLRAPAGAVLSGADAYAFLLETICGLRSPMLGETQVLGQFRAFLASLPRHHAEWLHAIGQDLINDARAIREKHLRGLGSRSYGSAVRRHLGGIQVVALAGTGQLASELLPYLSEDRCVEQWSRADIASGGSGTPRDGAAALVIAAPIDAEAIARIARGYSNLVRVLDLRAASERDRVRASAEVITLDDLFAAVEESTAAASARVDAARAEIRKMSRAYDERQQVRPFGWDDLCA